MKKLNFYVTFLFLLIISSCAKDELIDIEQQIETETDKQSSNKQAPISEPAPLPGDEDDYDTTPPGSIDNPIQLEAVEVVHTVTTYVLISFSTERSMNIRDLVFFESDLPGLDLGQFSGGGVSPLVEALLEEAAENALQELEEWEEQIDDANLKQCLKDILNKMTSLQTGVGFVLRNFAGNTPALIGK